MVTLDVAKTPEDFHQCKELLSRTHPGEPLPNFAMPGNTTFVVRDSEREPEKIRGVIHCELAPEISHMAVDPDYQYRQASFTLLHQFTEGNLRIGGHKHCYHTVQETNLKLIEMLNKCGAEVINAHDVRLKKEL